MTFTDSPFAELERLFFIHGLDAVAVAGFDDACLNYTGMLDEFSVMSDAERADTIQSIRDRVGE